MNRTFCGVATLTALTIALSLAPAPARAAVIPRDAIDMSQVTVYNSPADVGSWPATTAISTLSMSRPNGLSFAFDALATWPDYLPPGWDGPLEYTVWAVVNINGRWYASGFIQMWRDRASTGAPILTDFARNWVYDARWGPMMGHQPVVGEQMGFFVTAGNARGVTTVTSLRERSNVVMVSLPANDTGVFTFAAFAQTNSMVVADFNGDSHPDIMAQSDAGIVTMAVGNVASFTQPVSPYNGITSSWRIAGAGDFNRDGRRDLVWQGPTGRVAVWLNNGSAQPTVLDLYAGASDWRVVAVADIDRDGNSDLIWQSPTGQVVVWFMQGATMLRGEFLWSGASTWRVAGAGDFNGDGDADLLWQGPTGALVVWTLHGTSIASNQLIYGAATFWQVLSAGDVDGDGKPDILWRGPTGQIVAWTMNGLAASGALYVNESIRGWQLSTTP